MTAEAVAARTPAEWTSRVRAARRRGGGGKAARATRERQELVERMLPLARRLASRYRHGGESLEDLEQVACLGLIKAAERYDPSRGPFAPYATPTILGELRRHFRDKSWGLHVTRSIQESFLRVNEATDRLYGQLGRAPSAKEIAAETGLELEDVIEAISAGSSYTPAALDAPLPGGEDDGATSLGDTLGASDPGYELVELRASLGPAFDSLPPRERRIVHMRFVEDLTQSQIAERIGISQMHVSRLLRAALERLHDAALADRPQAA